VLLEIENVEEGVSKNGKRCGKEEKVSRSRELTTAWQASRRDGKGGELGKES
jgi:hypothetical protein